MDIKQLVLAATACLSYLARAAPTERSTEVAHRSDETDLQPTPEGRLSSFDVVARHIPPYMQKIVAEAFIERENQEVREAYVESSYENVDLQIGGESLFRERRSLDRFADFTQPVVLTNQTEHVLEPIPVRSWNQPRDMYIMKGVGIASLHPTIENKIVEQLRENDGVICNKPIAVRGYSTKPGRDAPFYYYAACTPAGAPLFCMSERINCEELTRFQEVPIPTQRGYGDFKNTSIPVNGSVNSSALFLPLLEIGHQFETSFNETTQYELVSGTLRPFGVFRGFAWGTDFYNDGSDVIRYYVSAKQLNQTCAEVKNLCADDLRGCKTLTATSTIMPTPSVRTATVNPMASSGNNSYSMTYSLAYSKYVSCPSSVVITTAPVLTTSPAMVPTSSSPVSWKTSMSSSYVQPTLVLTEAPTQDDGVNIELLAAGAVGAAAGGMLVLTAAGLIKLCSNFLKKNEMQISAPLQPDQEVYSEVRDGTLVRVENYPPSRPGVPPSRALMNLSYSRVRTISETSSNMTAGTVSTESAELSTVAEEPQAEDHQTEEYVPMGSAVTAIYDMPPQDERSAIYNVLPPRPRLESEEKVTNL